MPLRALLANITPRGRIVLGAVALGTIVVLILLMRMASAPSYTTLLTGLDPAQTGKVTVALDTKGIGYELQNNGTALAVDKGQTAQARIALASAGLPGTAQPGYELLDRQALGTSNFQQNINYQRALEGEIAKTIEQVQGVSGAQVQLVLPDREAQLFSDNTSPATAAVLLDGATALDPGSVRGIAQLVTSSVPGLQSDKVTITDGSGQLLWPTGSGSADGTAGDTGGLLAKQAAEARYDQQMAGALTAMLARTVGPDKVQVQVHADLNANQATQEQLVYGRRGVPLQAQSETETLRGGGGGAGGTAGTGANTPAYAQATAGGRSDYRRSTANDTFGVDKTITHTRIAPGAVNTQQVSVLIDRSVPASAIPQIRAAVASAAGIVARRGDLLTVGQVAFVRLPAAPSPSPVATFGGYVKYLFLGIAVLGFLGFVTRQLRRRERETLAGEPTWLSEIEAPRTLAELERLERDDHPTQVRPLRTPEQPARLQVEDLVTRDPDRVAQQVRAWMAEDDK
ncbi:MAG TPA: flagellar basal-body MS-ring/collar protein FliF [Conexibacter sp.]|jgi:flagellar M-ring protein FliF|nr:flagellar basal-body MS-ring/collar protein FliF [Conexibacter sp.]